MPSRPGNNQLEIEVANRWPNRMLGDQQPPDKDARTVKWESGLLGGKEFKTGRYTFTTGHGLGKLLPSGLIGPVTLLVDAAVGGTCAARSKYSDSRTAATLWMDAKDYDPPESNGTSYMRRHIGLAWLDLPLSVPRFNK